MSSARKLSEWSRSTRDELRRTALAWFAPATIERETCREKLNLYFKDRWKIEDCDVYELIHENFNSPKDPTAPNFIVWLDAEMDVDWSYDGSLPNEANELVTQAEAMQARRCKHLPHEQILEFKRIVGHAVVCGIRGSKTSSQNLVKEAAKFLRERTVERSRVWTLGNAHFLFFGLVLLEAVILHFVGNQISGFDPTMIVTASGGLLGAYLSIIQNAGNGKWDAAAGIGAHRIEVATKLLAGFLVGAVIFVLSKSTHAPESLKAITTDNYSQFILGIFAGLTERLIPKILTDYSLKELTKD